MVIQFKGFFCHSTLGSHTTGGPRCASLACPPPTPLLTWYFCLVILTVLLVALETGRNLDMTKNYSIITVYLTFSTVHLSTEHNVQLIYCAV